MDSGGGTAIMESLDPGINNDAFSLLGTGVPDPVAFRNIAGSPDSHYRNMLGSACSKTSLPDVLTSDLQSMDLAERKAFLLLDQLETLTVETEERFCGKLGSDPAAKVKVVAILGNTGEGKSFTLNQTFFNGEEVFTTSQEQESCTSGVWAAYDGSMGVVVLDTEGMLGLAQNENLRTRLLLKVLAVSDIVIYRTRAARLHNDLFYFLGDASKAYNKHFRQELDTLREENTFSQQQDGTQSKTSPTTPVGSDASLGPAVIVFHETQHTDPLGWAGNSTADAAADPEGSLRRRFNSMKQDIGGFSKLVYIGTKTESNLDTDFNVLRERLHKELKDNSVRSPRNVAHVFQAFKCLNSKFSGEVTQSGHRSFPDEYFTCAATCQSCLSRCCKQMKHKGEHHTEAAQCSYSAQYENKVFTCINCQKQGRTCIVVPKATGSKDSSLVGLAMYAWSGYVLECRTCGIIYRSRQQWYGNVDPERQGVVATSIAHVWPGDSGLVYSWGEFDQVRSLQGTQNAARRLIDGVTALSGTVSEVSGAPAATIKRWAADQVAPSYWRPNADIVDCFNCHSKFTATSRIHHCRNCGEGFCSTCSNYQRPVPDKGWGFHPVRVCKTCYELSPGAEDVLNLSNRRTEPSEIKARRVGESVLGTVTSLANALEIPITVIKDSARPEYWVPDHEITSCSVCSRQIGPKAPASYESTSVHHCRQCGKGVCNKCSETTRPVPSRGWDTPVRVCDDCLMMPED